MLATSTSGKVIVGRLLSCGLIEVAKSAITNQVPRFIGWAHRYQTLLSGFGLTAMIVAIQINNRKKLKRELDKQCNLIFIQAGEGIKKGSVVLSNNAEGRKWQEEWWGVNGRIDSSTVFSVITVSILCAICSHVAG